MAADFRKRFFVSLAVTLPILILSPQIQSVLGIREPLAFAGDQWVLTVLFFFVFFFSGWPFITGLFQEFAKRQPGMMTLIAMVFGLKSKGSRGVVDEKTIHVVSSDYLRENDLTVDDPCVEESSDSQWAVKTSML